MSESLWSYAVFNSLSRVTRLHIISTSVGIISRIETRPKREWVDNISSSSNEANAVSANYGQSLRNREFRRIDNTELRKTHLRIIQPHFCIAHVWKLVPAQVYLVEKWRPLWQLQKRQMLRQKGVICYRGAMAHGATDAVSSPQVQFLTAFLDYRVTNSCKITRTAPKIWRNDTQTEFLW